MPAKSTNYPWGLRTDSRLELHLASAPKSVQRRAEVRVHMGEKAIPPKDWRTHFPAETESQLRATVRVTDSAAGVKVLVSPMAAEDLEKDPRLKAPVGARIRDAVGAAIGALERLEIQWAEWLLDIPAAELEAAITGMEMALYRFKRVLKNEDPKLLLRLLHKDKELKGSQLRTLTSRGQAVNLARHLVNLPPNWLNPVSYADAMKILFRGFKNFKTEVWDEARLQKEGAGLLLGVGSGAKTPPRLVHLSYRTGSARRAPVVFVGKGITFDSGGLDIKTSSGMRLMKKDMGGSAAVVGVALYAALTQPNCPLDFYLALAENAVSERSYRPGDILTARNGSTVEIHNTDAEGRLVLADALDVAITQKDKPGAVIDIATLTGAIKVGLGSQLAGLFSNDSQFASALAESGQKAGDPAWIMPLYQKYRGQLDSGFAEMVNAADGFGGAVTAALFLEKFVGATPWAHFDIYAWKDSPDGAWLEPGGSGQAVLGVIEWLQSESGRLKEGNGNKEA
ncbi:MAG: M17 family metallopeptidase [Bdellovibrionales bacterium]